MQPDERLESVRLLRERGQTPKQIARALGIRPGEAARLVRVAAAGAQAEAPGPALTGCWISPGWSTGLTVHGHPDWLLHEDPAAGIDGLAAVLVARKYRHGKVSVCGYLADLYCLGVKERPRPEYRWTTSACRGLFAISSPDSTVIRVEVPIDQALEVVLGSAGYARSLGFDPHPDFAAAEEHLGPWTDPGAITFGKDGKPLYISGPYDDPRPVWAAAPFTAGPRNSGVTSLGA